MLVDGAFADGSDRNSLRASEAVSDPTAVWINRPVEPSFAEFSSALCESLSAYGVNALGEGRKEIDSCSICVFLISPRFFTSKRSLRNMLNAVSHGKVCATAVLPGPLTHSLTHLLTHLLTRLLIDLPTDTPTHRPD